MLPHQSIITLPSVQKHRRRTIHLTRLLNNDQRESFYAVYIRELTITQAGLGCAVWDGAIILARYLHYQQSICQLLSNSRVLELGSGVGLPGIVCARYADVVYMSDYEDEVVKNAMYNAKLNSNLDDQQEEEYDKYNYDQSSVDHSTPIIKNSNLMKIEELRMKSNVESSAKGVLIDWHDIPRLNNEGDWVDRKDNSSHSRFVDPTSSGSFSFNLLIGSEIMYTLSEEHRQSLAATVDYYLAPNSIFYCLQSANREGMKEFVEHIMEEYDYRVESERCEDWEWMKGMNLREKGLKGFIQREEEYWLYKFYKPDNVREKLINNNKKTNNNPHYFPSNSDVNNNDNPTLPQLPTVRYALDAEAIYSSSTSTADDISSLHSIMLKVTSDQVKFKIPRETKQVEERGVELS